MAKPPAPPPKREQRQHPRIEDIFAQVEVSSGSEVHVLGARNASMGGLYLEARPADYSDLKTGRVVRVVLFSADDGVEQLQAEASIVRTDDGKSGTGSAGFGLMWRTLDPRTMAALTRFLAAVRGK